MPRKLLKSESEIEQVLAAVAAGYACILLRNNSGALADKDGRVVRYGLGNVSPAKNKIFKSSDEIGITRVTITQAMVGQTIGVFTAVEMKKEGWKYSGTPEEIAQQNFIDWVNTSGGKAGFANDVDSLLKIIGR